MGTIYKGIVQRGAKRGAALGFPTANIPLDDAELSGIYAGRVILKEGEAPYMAAIFIDRSRKLLEMHILDFSNDLYGQHVSVELLQRIRDSRVFESDDLLTSAIKDDVERVREYFRTQTL